MKLELNTEKSPFCSIGPFSFTFGQQECDIDVDQLPDEYKKQLLYNINRGTLLTEDKEALASLVSSMQQATPVPVEQIPIQHNQVSQRAEAPVKDPIKEDLKPLRALLRGTVATVKKEAATYSIGRLRKLLELEKDLKNRKSVVTFLEEQLERHQNAVKAVVIGEDTGPVNQGDPFAQSTQITDIVESEEEEVTFRQGDLPDEDGDLLLSQEVLNKLEE